MTWNGYEQSVKVGAYMIMQKKDRTKVKKETKIEMKSVIKSIESKRGLFEIISGLLVSLYFAVNFVYKVIYRSECEKFYGLPGKYFDSNVDDRLLYLFCSIIILLMGIVPVLIKRYYEKIENSTKCVVVESACLAILVGMEIGLFNVYNLIEIMQQTYKTSGVMRLINDFLIKNPYMTVIVIVILASISVLGITFLDGLKYMKHKLIKNISCIILWVSLVCSLLLIIYGTFFKFYISIDDKTRYEFVTYDIEYVILSTYDEKVLMVPFEIDENGQYIFKTNHYIFGEPYEGIYQYKNIKYSPKIDKNVEY